MAQVHSFEPVIGADPRILVLGSMPGVISLQAMQYYGNPRNAFWSIMAELFSIDIDCSYEQRIAQIKLRPLILWDTIKSCHREGSLDSNILKEQLKANNIVGLLETYMDVRLIAFNGAVSEKYFNQLVKPNLPKDRALKLIKMPSTSPANASYSFEKKLLHWRQILDAL